MANLDHNYENILIVGNGFDLNQGLSTSYSDFVESLEFNNLIISNNALAIYLKNQKDLINWIDIEIELKKYSSLLEDSKIIKNLRIEFLMLSTALKKYLSKINYSKLDKSKDSYKLLNRLKDTDLLILDFNYTHTVKTILLELGLSKDEIENRLIKVHNSVDEDIIFGVEDSARINPLHVFLRKAYNKSFKAINVKSNLDNLKQLVVYGYSLGETDHMYYNEFFRNLSYSHMLEKGKSLFFFYYGDDGYDQLFIQIDKLTQNNLTLFKQNNRLEFINSNK